MRDLAESAAADVLEERGCIDLVETIESVEGVVHQTYASTDCFEDSRWVLLGRILLG